jgi:hypothetical protein
MKKIAFLLLLIPLQLFANDSSLLQQAFKDLAKRPSYVPEDVAQQLILHPGTIATIKTNRIAAVKGVFYPFGGTVASAYIERQISFRNGIWQQIPGGMVYEPDYVGDMVFSTWIVALFCMFLLWALVDRWDFLKRYRQESIKGERYAQKVVSSYTDRVKVREYVTTIASIFVIFMAVASTVAKEGGSAVSFSAIQIPLWFMAAGIASYQMRRFIIWKTVQTATKQDHLVAA